MRFDAFPWRPYIWMLMPILLLLSTTCSPKIKGWSQESYRSSGFDNDALNQERLALLPVIVLERPIEKANTPEGRTLSAPYTPPQSPPGDSEGGVPLNAHDAYRVCLGEILLSKIQSRQPNLRLVPSNDALKRLNDEGLTGAYLKFNRNFPKVGFDSASLKDFGRALNCRYLLVTQAVVTESKADASLSIIWTFGRQSVLHSVRISGQIWDTVSGQQVWEGSGVGYNRLTAYEGLPLIEEMANQAVDRLLDTIMP
ncbi:MAG: hypothetical protein RDU59_03385 [Thermodesulfobacteriota bacterium]|nr:hypothetical protein [Thermodesulfobacteriota bacterium]